MFLSFQVGLQALLRGLECPGHASSSSNVCVRPPLLFTQCSAFVLFYWKEKLCVELFPRCSLFACHHLTSFIWRRVQRKAKGGVSVCIHTHMLFLTTSDTIEMVRQMKEAL